MAQRVPPARGSDAGAGSGPDPDRLGAFGPLPHPDITGAPGRMAALPPVPPLPASAAPPADAPFVCQHERRLLLLHEEPIGWVLAELRFDAARCRYLEVRRTVYHSPREAGGALLARLTGAGESVLARTAEGVLRWLTEHRGAIGPGKPGGRPA